MFWKPKYKIWWNDKEDIKAQKKILIPLLVVSALFYYFTIFNLLNIKEYFVLSFFLGGWVYGIIEYFYKLPNGFIDEENDSEKTKSRTRLAQFIIFTFLFYLCTVGILQHHFPFFEQLVCCDLVRNFNLDIK